MQNLGANALKNTFSEPTLKQIARILVFLAFVLVLAGLGMKAASINANGEDVSFWSSNDLFPLIAFVYSFLGLLILRKHPRHTVGWLFLFVGNAASLNILNNGYSAFDRDVMLGNSDIALNISIQLGHIIWWPIVILPISLILLYFPNGKLPSPRWGIVVVSTIFGIFLGMLTSFHSEPMLVWVYGYPNLPTLKFIDRLLAGLVYVSTALLLMGVIGSLTSVFIRFRRSIGVERLQMKWLVYCALVTVCLSFAPSIINIFFPYSPAIEHLNNLISEVLSLFIPVACGIAIIRHGLWDIDIFVNRTLVYGSLTTMVIIIYIVIVGSFSIMFQSRTNSYGGLVAAGIIAILFQPLRESLQNRVNRMLYGARDNPAEVLTRLAHQLEISDTANSILPNLVQTIAQLLKIPYVSILLPNKNQKMETVSSFGEVSNIIQTTPITFQKMTIGELVVSTRGPNENFTQHEQDLLATIAALTATTIHSLQLSNQLRRSRQRIVATREDERRRLRRDLHDGLGPQLASQTLGLEAISQLIPTDPKKAQVVLNSLKTQAKDAFQDLRHLVYGLRPPALDDKGLIGALRQSASRYETGNLIFRFDVPEELTNLPAAVESAAYRIALEAITNVTLHSQASECNIRIYCIDSFIVIEVKDNGCGLSHDYQPGVGLQAMKERSLELNGEIIIKRRVAGGTLIQAKLPMGVYGE